MIEQRWKNQKFLHWDGWFLQSWSHIKFHCIYFLFTFHWFLRNKPLVEQQVIMAKASNFGHGVVAHPLGIATYATTIYSSGTVT